MWDPEADYPQSSYVEPVVDPGTAPGDGPLVCLQINAAWIPYIVGSVMQLGQPPAWTTTDPTALADLLGRLTDLIALIGTAGACMFRLTSECGLQYSLDGGTIWVDVTDWTINFPLCVRSNQARVVMDPAYSDPPIPEQITGNTDWVYAPDP